MELLLFFGLLLIPVAFVVIRYSLRVRRRQLERAPQRELTATDSYLERLADAKSADEVDRINEQERRRRGD